MRTSNGKHFVASNRYGGAATQSRAAGATFFATVLASGRDGRHMASVHDQRRALGEASTREVATGPAPGKQTLSEQGAPMAPAEAPSHERRGSAGGNDGMRAEAWQPGPGLMSAMGLGEFGGEAERGSQGAEGPQEADEVSQGAGAPMLGMDTRATGDEGSVSENDRGDQTATALESPEQAAERESGDGGEGSEAEGGGGSSGSDGGGGGGDTVEAAEVPQAEPEASVEAKPGTGNSQLSDFDRFFAAAPPPAGEGPSAASAPPAPGSTVDVAAPSLGSSSEQQVEGIARAAVEGASAPVPHLERLQRAFGPEHDLTGLRAQVGGKAPRAAELGATHFAFGTSLYFGHSPTLGEAAHEVAHALLQREGRGPQSHQQDPAAEAHANEIARRVEAGEQVAELLPKRRSGPSVAKVQRQPTPEQDFLQSSWKFVNDAGVLHDNTGARLRTAPSSTAPILATLPQNTKVQILKHHPTARWYAVVTADGQLGYIADWLVWRFLPEPSANIYLIKKGDTPIDIARAHYGASFDRWGQDLRFVVNALVYVNNQTRHNGTGGPGLSKPGGVSESWLKAAAAEEVKIWLPSVDYLNSIYEQVRKHGGGTGSISFDTFAGIADKVGIASVLPSYVGGLAHGFFANLGDTVQAVFGLIKSIFAGEIIEDLKKLWAALSKLTIKDVVEGIGSWAQSWAPRLFSENHFVRGHAWGYFAGYLCAEIAMFALGGAALNALKASKLATKLGQVIARVAPRLTAAVGRVAAAGRASTQALREAKDAVLRRFGQAAAAVGDFAARAVWNRTAAGKRMLKLFGAAADDMFRPIGGGLVDIYGELKIAGPALDALSDDDLRKLVKLCKDKGPPDAYAHFEASSTAGGKPGARLRFESRLQSRAQSVAKEILDDLGLSPSDARAKIFAQMTDGDKVRLWDLFNEQAFKTPELRKQAAQWAMGKSPKSVRELVAQMQFFEAEVKRQALDIFTRAKTAAEHAIQKATTSKGSPLSQAERLQIFRNTSEAMLGRKLDAMGDAARKQAVRAALEDPAARARTMKTADTSWETSVKAQQGVHAPGVLDLGSVADSALPRTIQNIANKLSFSNVADGAYHAHKHAGELAQATTAATEMVEYLREARDLIRTTAGKVRHNQTGSRSVVFESATHRAIVAVSTDGRASIATFGSK